MKSYKVTLFLFSCIGVLALLCILFPRDGVQAAGTTLSFPTLTEVLTSADAEASALPAETPEQLLARQMEEMQMKQKTQYLHFFANSPLRMYLPDNDLTFFDPLFRALENADQSLVRIVHYGDSQLEGDRITGRIREELQDTFGGIGPGLLPFIQTVGSVNTAQSCSVSLRRALAYGPAYDADSVSLRASDKRYGPMAQVAYLTPDSVATISVSPRSKKELAMHNRAFTRVTLLAENTSSPLSVTFRGETRTVQPSSEMQHITFHVAEPIERASLSVRGRANLYGITFSGENGVTVDNVPMRGCSGTMFTNISQKQLSSYYQREGVRLIIMQYGGNSVPYLKNEKGIATYAAQLKRQIEYLQAAAPDARILFIGPSDMSTRIKGEWQTYPLLPDIIDAIRTAANEAGAAYWDMYQVMGGRNSMAQWCQEQPPLAGSDHIHFTFKGSERVADLFCKSLMLYYDYYQWRKTN